MLLLLTFFLKIPYNNYHDSQSVHESQEEPISPHPLSRSPAVLNISDSEDYGSAGASNNSPETELNVFQSKSSDSEGETLSSRGECDAQPDLVMINADLFSWPVVLSQKHRDIIISKEPLSHSLKQ